jgi:NTE family protein
MSEIVWSAKHARRETREDRHEDRLDGRSAMSPLGSVTPIRARGSRTAFVRARALVSGLRGQRDHLVIDRALRRLLHRHVEFDGLADAPVPLHLVAFDVTEGCEVLLSSGSVVDAIAAAAAMPGIFPPVRLSDRHLIDGGVVNNTPVSRAVELGAERVYVLPIQEQRPPLGRAPRGALDAAIYGLRVLVRGRLEADLARYSREVELIVLPAPNPLDVQPTDFEPSSRLISGALAAGRARLAAPHHRLRVQAA